ncbi:MAG TPA: WYL domain-containing protein [Mogibacterium sp.]|nr:WYL domain-containing protein [Mogibacterium sp.]
MIFNELYGAYYAAVSKIIAKAIDKPLKKEEIRKIAEECAFGESAMNIEAALHDERWQLILPDGSTPIINKPTMPLTKLQKRWMKAISQDPRVRLFEEVFPDLDDVEPLFDCDDIVVFDKYSDGDPYTDKEYIRNFRLILDAIRNRYPLRITAKGGKGREFNYTLMPEYLEYSEKDDKFRMIGTGRRGTLIVNLGRIISCESYGNEYIPEYNPVMKPEQATVEMEIVDERNALERVLLHFAHFENRAERIDENRYKISVTYDKDDLTEILIRILSFGPVVKVTGPGDFVKLIKERLISQKSCEQ